MTSALIDLTPSSPTRSRPPAPVAHPVREVATYVGLVTAMVVGIALALPTAGFAPLASMVTPLVAVLLITFLRTPRGERRALWGTFALRHAGWRSWPIAFVVGVLAVFVIPYGVADLLGSAEIVLPSSTADVLAAGLNLVVGLVMLTLLSMTEEIGWRSYLLPRMQMLVTRRRAAIAVGFVHGLFHLPLILLTDTYDSVGSRWIVAPTVVLALTAAGVIYAWIKDRSGSVWPVAFAHATVNVVIDGAGLVVVLAPVALAHTASESGLVTLAAIAACAAVLLVRGRTWGDTRSSR